MESHEHHHDHRTCRPRAWRAATPLTRKEVVRDPVCGMTVDPHAGKPTAEHGGRCSISAARLPREIREEPERFIEATDPVCGMTVDRASARHFLRHEGTRTISARPAASRSSRPRPRNTKARGRRRRRCRRARNTPARCTRRSSATSPAPARSAAWRWSRWACRPATKGPNPELVDFTRRFWVSAALSHSAARHHHGADARPAGARLDRRAARGLDRTGAGHAGRAVGSDPVLPPRLANRIVNRSPNMWTLISLGVGVAYVYSVVATLFPGHLSAPVPRPWRRGAGLFRGGERHRRAGLPRPGAGAQGARAHRLGDPRAARPRAEDGAADRRRRDRGRRPARRGAAPATACASARATASRSTASCSKAAPRSTNR